MDPNTNAQPMPTPTEGPIPPPASAGPTPPSEPTPGQQNAKKHLSKITKIMLIFGAVAVVLLILFVIVAVFVELNHNQNKKAAAPTPVVNQRTVSKDFTDSEINDYTALSDKLMTSIHGGDFAAAKLTFSPNFTTGAVNTTAAQDALLTLIKSDYITADDKAIYITRTTDKQKSGKNEYGILYQLSGNTEQTDKKTYAYMSFNTDKKIDRLSHDFAVSDLDMLTKFNLSQEAAFKTDYPSAAMPLKTVIAQIKN